MTGEEAKFNAFVGGKHLAGIEDFKEAYESTQLQKLMNDAGAKHNGAIMHDIVYTKPWAYSTQWNKWERWDLFKTCSIIF